MSVAGFAALDPNAFDFGGAFRQGRERRRQEDYSSDLASMIAGNDYQGALSRAAGMGDIERVLGVRSMQQGEQERSRADQERLGPVYYRAADRLLAQRDPAERRRLADMLYQRGVEMGFPFQPFDDNDLSDETLSRMRESLAVYGGEGRESFTLGKDQIRFGPDNQPVAYGPTEDEADFTPYQSESLRLREAADARAAASADRQAAAAERQAANMTFENERGLAREFTQLTSDYRDVAQMFNTVQSVGGRQDAAGDLALVVAYTKILDPGSVAREGEVRLTQTTESALQTARMMLPRLEQGQTLLPAEVRNALIAAAQDVFGQYQAAYERRANEYRGLAQQYGFESGRVVPASDPSASAPKPAPAPEQAGALTPDEEAELQMLRQQLGIAPQ